VQRIKVNNLNKSRRIKKKAIERAALRVLKSFGKENTLVDITFVTDRKIKALNKKYMKRNYSTDVLAFSFEENALPGRRRAIGDIYISSDTAHKNAKRFKTSFKKELTLYTVHGLLHLLGFGDKTRKEKKRIRRTEKRLLEEISRWKLKRKESKTWSKA